MLYLNGKIIEDSKACITADDRGLLLGDGLFETLRCVDGRALDLAAHWQRLQTGADYLQIPLRYTITEVEQAITDLLTSNQLDGNAGARITLTRGPGPRGLLPSTSINPTLLITVFANTLKKENLTLLVSDITVNEQSPLTQFKTLNYLDKIVARQRAQQAGCDDAILLNTRGHIVCTTSANIFIVKNGTLYTPPLSDGALPGITRQTICAECAIIEKSLTTHQLSRADKVFITNSLIQQTSIDQVSGGNHDVIYRHSKKH